jgi:pilus assembly protein CpaC
MKHILSVCILLAMSMTAHGQPLGGDSHAVGAGTQVVVRLQIAEVSLTKLHRMGFDLARVVRESEVSLAKLQRAGFDLPRVLRNSDTKNIDSANFNAQWSALMKDGTKTKLILDALRKDDLAKILAEPTLVTTSGKTAVVNAGEELSVPKPKPDGSVTMERQYGAVVKVTPEVRGDRIRVAIDGSLSEVDYEHTVRVGEEDVPGVGTREFVTRTELKSGQTLAISGPTQTVVEVENRGLPYLSEVPYVGALFCSTVETQNEIAMLIVVQPEIVQSPTTVSQ